MKKLDLNVWKIEIEVIDWPEPKLRITFWVI